MSFVSVNGLTGQQDESMLGARVFVAIIGDGVIVESMESGRLVTDKVEGVGTDTALFTVQETINIANISGINRIDFLVCIVIFSLSA